MTVNIFVQLLTLAIATFRAGAGTLQILRISATRSNQSIFFLILYYRGLKRGISNKYPINIL
ncbi:hypothetical protein OA07_20365 [Aphanizomenon flos-aquae 2012/KM1/D3]|nr:hypothetical protein OA07_20365 [Aphanizomenon flos-aquae 2012/KM1/D3]